jgi:hypothetical protein
MFAFQGVLVYLAVSTLSKPMTSLDPRGAPPQPPCECCQEDDRVLPVRLVGIEPDVQFWRCERCGYAWGTRNGEPFSV